MSATSVSISNSCIELIKNILPNGGTILEFGSGDGTILLSEYFTMYSIENQPEWQNRYPLCTTYINVDSKMYDDVYTCPDIPDNKGWYNIDHIIPQLPKKYDLMLIDGPGGGRWGRAGFLKHIDMFNTNVPMIFDDVNRESELILMQKVSEIVNRPYQVLSTDKSVGYIL